VLGKVVVEIVTLHGTTFFSWYWQASANLDQSKFDLCMQWKKTLYFSLFLLVSFKIRVSLSLYVNMLCKLWLWGVEWRDSPLVEIATRGTRLWWLLSQWAPCGTKATRGWCLSMVPLVAILQVLYVSQSLEIEVLLCVVYIGTYAPFAPTGLKWKKRMVINVLNFIIHIWERKQAFWWLGAWHGIWQGAENGCR
jgi:hypothetical protein